MHKKLSFKFLMSLAFLLLAWPGGAMAKVKVVASLPTLAAIAAEVGGERVDVTALSSHSQDPHYVDPKPNLVLALNKADLLILNGLELEAAWLGPVIAGARNPSVAVGGMGYLDVSTLVPQLMQVPTAAVDRSQGDIHGGGNPHFLIEPATVAAITRGVAARLAQLDTEGAQGFMSRGEALAQRLDALQAEGQKKMATLSSDARKVVSYHESFPYLYRWLGLTQVATVEPRPGIPPTPSRIATVVSTMRGQGARVIVQEAYQPTNVSKTLISMTGGALVTVEGGVNFDAGQSVTAWMRTNLEVIYAALTS